MSIQGNAEAGKGDNRGIPIPLPYGHASVENGNVILTGVNPSLYGFFSIEAPQGTPPNLLDLLSSANGGVVEEAVIDGVLKFHTEVLMPRETAQNMNGRSIIYKAGDRYIQETIYPDGTVLFNDHTRRMELYRGYLEGSKDALTNLYGRGYLIEKIEEALRNGEEFAIIFLDVDYFKSINDAFGHHEGDNTLAKVGGVLSKSIRTSDKVRNRIILEQMFEMGMLDHVPEYFDLNEGRSVDTDRRSDDDDGDDVVSGYPSRWGGDEFVLFIKGAKKEDIENLTQRIREELGNVRFGDGRTIEVSLGASHSLDFKQMGIEDALRIVGKADEYMYRMKLEHHMDKVREKLKEGKVLSYDAIDLMMNLSLRLLDSFPDIDKRSIQNIIQSASILYLNDLSIELTIDKMGKVPAVPPTETVKGIIPSPIGHEHETDLRRKTLRINQLISHISFLIGGNPEDVAGILASLSEEINIQTWPILSEEAKLVFLLKRYTQFRSEGIDDGRFIGSIMGITGKDDSALIKFKKILNIEE